MTGTSFEDILNQQVDETVAPPVLPVGTYHTIIVGLPESGKSTQRETPFFKFTHRVLSAMDDVDEGILNEQFPEGIAGKEITNSYYITDKSAFMLADFIKNCGVDTAGKSIRACIDELPNREVLVGIKHEPSPDGQRIFARVGRTAPVE